MHMPTLYKHANTYHYIIKYTNMYTYTQMTVGASEVVSSCLS